MKINVHALRAPAYGWRALSTSHLRNQERPTSLVSPHGSVWARIRQGTFPHLLSKASCTASPDFCRWWVPPASFMVQISIGSVYAWSMWNFPLTHELGVVVSSAHDWTFAEVVRCFSLTATSLGCTTFFLGPWTERAGPRYVAVASAICYSTALVLSGVGCLYHSLPLVYLGYGVFGGMGWGFGYISPVSTLLRWFPDRRGLAGGLALSAFGGGAAVAAPVINYLTTTYFKAPTYLGKTVDICIRDGAQYAEGREVVYATQGDLAAFPMSSTLEEGFYLVGTGDTGAAAAFFTLAAAYGSIMTLGALSMRIPQEGWRPPNWAPPPEVNLATSVQYQQALRTPQFYLLWTAVMGNACAGMALMSSARTVMADSFGAIMPEVVTPLFCANYVAALSLASAVGRFGWAFGSDYLGRKNTYLLFGAGIPIMAALPQATQFAAAHPTEMLPLATFCGGTFVIISFYGGVFSVLPAYIADLFGQKHVGAIHGRTLTAWSAAALVGPTLLTTLNARANVRACHQLADCIDDATFTHAFQCTKADLGDLIAAKTATIVRLLELCPPGTIDPTMTLYDTTFFGIAGMMTLACGANALLTKVDRRHFS